MLTYIIDLLKNYINGSKIGVNAVMGYDDAVDKSCSCPAAALSVKNVSIANETGDAFTLGYKKADACVFINGYFTNANEAYEKIDLLALTLLNYSRNDVSISFLDIGSVEYKKQCNKYVCQCSLKLSFMYKNDNQNIIEDDIISNVISKGELIIDDLQ